MQGRTNSTKNHRTMTGSILEMGTLSKAPVALVRPRPGTCWPTPWVVSYHLCSKSRHTMRKSSLLAWISRTVSKYPWIRWTREKFTKLYSFELLWTKLPTLHCGYTRNTFAGMHAHYDDTCMIVCDRGQFRTSYEKIAIFSNARPLAWWTPKVKNRWWTTIGNTIPLNT